MKIDVKHEAALREALFASQVLVAGRPVGWIAMVHGTAIKKAREPAR